MHISTNENLWDIFNIFKDPYVLKFYSNCSAQSNRPLKECKRIKKIYKDIIFKTMEFNSY